MDCSTCSLTHSSCQVKRCTFTILSSHGWSVSCKVCGVWRICVCSPSRGWKRIGAEDGWQMEIRCMAGQKRHHRRASGQNWRRNCLRAKRTTRRRVQQVRRKPPCSCWNTAEAEDDDSGHPTCSWTSCSSSCTTRSDPKMRRRSPQQNQRKTKKYRGCHQPQKRHQECRAQAQARGAQKHKIICPWRNEPKRPSTLVSAPDDPVKRRLLKKTDLKSDDVLTPVEIEDTDLLPTVNALLNDKNAEDAKHWSEELEKTKILTVFDDHEEMMKGRQKELNSLKEMGVMTAVKRSDAVGKQVIQTRWVDREKDGRVKSRRFLKDFNQSQGRIQREMFLPTPSTLSLNTMSLQVSWKVYITIHSWQIRVVTWHQYFHSHWWRFAVWPEKWSFCV